MRFIKVMIISCFLFISTFAVGSIFASANPVIGLSWISDFSGPLLQENKAGEKLFDLGIDTKESILTNLKKIFYPDMDAENALRKMLRNITIGVIFVFLIWAGIQFIIFGADSDEEVKFGRKSLLYIVYGAALIFLVVWLLGTALDLGSIEGATGNVSDNTLIGNFEDNVVLMILGFLKGFAFFMAIIFIIRYGYKMMYAFSEEEKLKEARKGILNIFIALVFIKVIDYIYFIAQQQDFKNLIVDFIVQISKFLGYLGGIMFFLAILYAGYQFITSSGDEEKVKKATTIIKSVFIIILIILLFMLVIYQVFNDLL